MAYCPKCGGEMGTMDRLCPKCGYDFPPAPPWTERNGSAYSPAVDLALTIGQFAAAVGCVISFIAAVVLLFRPHPPLSALSSLVLALVNLALYGILVGVQALAKRKTHT